MTCWRWKGLIKFKVRLIIIIIICLPQSPNPNHHHQTPSEGTPMSPHPCSHLFYKKAKTTFYPCDGTKTIFKIFPLQAPPPLRAQPALGYMLISILHKILSWYHYIIPNNNFCSTQMMAKTSMEEERLNQKWYN